MQRGPQGQRRGGQVHAHDDHDPVRQHEERVEVGLQPGRSHTEEADPADDLTAPPEGGQGRTDVVGDAGGTGGKSDESHCASLLRATGGIRAKSQVSGLLPCL